MSTATVRLGDVATFVRGITFKPADVLDGVTADAVGCMRTKNVQSKLDETDVWFLPKNFVANKNQVLQEGDLLVSTANSWNLVGKACWVPKLNYECTFGGFISALRATDALVDRRYLYYWFTSAKIQAKLRSFGNKTTNISNLSIKRANDLVIPLPPLAEQKRIAAILDKAAEIKAKREQAIAKLDELAQSTFVEMFGDVKNNVHSFAKKQLGDLIKLSSGDFLPASNMQENGQYPVYGGNGINGYHDAYMFEERRIVIGRVGAYCGCVHITNEKAWITDNALYVDVKDKDLDFDYLAYALMMANLNSVSSKSGQPLVSGSRIYPVEILQPPLSLQQKFAKAKARIDALKSDELRGMDCVYKLTLSLQHQAFTTGFNA